MLGGPFKQTGVWGGHQATVSHWDLAKSIFLAGFVGQGVLNKDHMVWIDEARPHPLVLWVLPLPENEFGKVIIWQTQNLQKICSFYYIYFPLIRGAQ